MSIKFYFYEDLKFKQFYPITFTRPVYTLRAGIVPLFKRLFRFVPDAQVGFITRDQISGVLAEQYPDYPVNIIKREDDDILLINGRIRNYGDLLERVKAASSSTRYFASDQIAAVLLKRHSLEGAPPLATPDMYQALLEKGDLQIVPDTTSAVLYNYLWEIMADIEKEIGADFVHLHGSTPPPASGVVPDGAIMIKPEFIRLGENVTICPGSIIDASNGPVFIDSGAKVEPQAAIYGPCYVGTDSVIVAGKVAASSIGSVCRVGGEVEESIFHSYVNKYHAGFIGHSYVGSWVNFGAMTTNSDLKNNYSNIRCQLNGESIDTGSIKVGSFIGDHTKFGIGTLLNTGINIGACCNIFGGGLILDKEISSFSWGNSSGYQKYQLDKAMETARRTAGRRGCEISQREADLLALIAEDKLTDDGCIDV